ncbi:cellulose binding domain-containing protein [Dactylosporangium sp. NBC_01737]|uniref:serine/threonine-protein kinase n=1 Tax=Dactylosporangium sp. NBC_01737 TaxID=2975959 RepID=UPI002E105C87|nr:cellulose binding domain-containing protein [Dactylosporangium sp. NBC_01737]
MINSPKLLSGRYRLIEPLGESGTSMVWRAYDEVLRRRVAVKLLAAWPRDAGQLHAGVQVAALLNHPNVSAVYDYGVAGDEPFVVMELVDGVSLADRLTRGRLPWRGAVEVCAYVAAALSAAHARRLVHSDIKPGSIMLTEDGVKVLGFGIAAVTSPRQTAGPAADVYALGMLLFSVLTGQPPADRKAGLLRGDPGLTPLPLIPGMPLEVAALYQHCVAPDPNLRPSAAALARRFADLAGVRVGAVDVRERPIAGSVVGLGTSATATMRLTGTRDLPATPARRPRVRRASVIVAVAGAVVAAAIGVAVAATALGPALSGGSTAARWSGTPQPSARSATPAGETGSASLGAKAPDEPSCRVTYQVKQIWDNGATVALSIANTGEVVTQRWTLTFDLAEGLQTRDGWNGAWQQQGARVTVAGLPGHPDLAAGSSVSDVGVSIDGRGATGIPGSFVLNGQRCQVTAQP